MYCSQRTIAIARGDKVHAVPLRCKSWTCPTCAPRRRARLIRECKEGKPNRFVTLTVNPHWLDSPGERGLALSRAWRDYVREYRRRWPHRQLEYMAVLELTARGEPHIHLTVRGGWIDQKDLSRWMNDRIGAPVVDVRMVKREHEVARYVSKYISKRPIRLATMKRYWRSSKYLNAMERKARRRAYRGRAAWIIDLRITELPDHVSRRASPVFMVGGDTAWWLVPEKDTPDPTAETYCRRLY